MKLNLFVAIFCALLGLFEFALFMITGEPMKLFVAAVDGGLALLNYWVYSLGKPLRR